MKNSPMAHVYDILKCLSIQRKTRWDKPGIYNTKSVIKIESPALKTYLKKLPLYSLLTYLSIFSLVSFSFALTAPESSYQPSQYLIKDSLSRSPQREFREFRRHIT